MRYSRDLTIVRLTETRLEIMNLGALALATFLACLVEAVEATTIVLAAGSTRGWRPAAQGAVAALVVLAIGVSVVGPAETIPFLCSGIFEFAPQRARATRGPGRERALELALVAMATSAPARPTPRRAAHPTSRPPITARLLG